MTCLYKNKQGTEILLAYGARALDTERAAALEQHASECSECRALLAAQRNLWCALDEVEAPDVSSDFDARLYARIAREDSQSGWRLSLQRWLRGFAPGGLSWKPLVAGVAAVGVLSVGLMFHAPERYAPEPQGLPSQVRPEAVDAEQVEVTLEDLEMLTPLAASGSQM